MKMDEEQFNSNLNTLRELVLDEQKLVTYVSLSKEMCIHVNDSKRLLIEFVEDIEKNRPPLQLNISYIVSGLTEDNKARTIVSSEKELANITDKFKMIFYKHIYSISKGLPSVDSVAFLAVNNFDDFPLCTGLIKGSSCVKRSSDEIGNLKSSSQTSVQVEQKPVPQPPKKVKEEKIDINKNGLAEGSSVTKVKESKSEPSIKLEVPSPKKDTSNAFKSKLETKKNGIKSQKGIAGFFNKSNSAPSKILKKEIGATKVEINVKKESDVIEKQVIKEEKMDVDEVVEKETVKEKEKVKEKVVKTEVKKEKVNGKSKSKSLSEIKKTAKVDKKRKRVLCVSDSESDDDKDPFVDEPEPEIENNESEDEIPPTPATNTVKITSGIINPKKKRKLVDKTYTDEEGYILTKKVEVYESCSDNEEEANTKENVQDPAPAVVNHIKLETSPKEKKTGLKNTKKKISPPQKGKQSTLMNFFKKV